MIVLPGTNQVSDRFSKPFTLLSSTIFGAVYVLAIAVAVLSAFFALSGAGRIGPASPALFFILLGNLVLIIGMGIYLAFRLLHLMSRSPSGQFAPRLHVRFATLFSAAALLPAIVVGLFFAIVYSQGIENWFSPVVETAVDRAATVAEAAFNAERDEIVSEIQPMAIDLNQPEAVKQLVEGPIIFTNYLRLQAQRRFFQAAYIIDSNGSILTMVEFEGAPEFAAPTTEALQAADSGSINLHFENEKNLIRGLYRLQAYDDAYLYVARFATGGSLLNLIEAQNARNAYREANSQRGQLTRSFILVYLEIALLVVIGAIWVGLAAANQIVLPIGRLAQAARKVRDGDMNVSVTPSKQNDELANLTRDFNEMTMRLATQRSDLITARDLSEQRLRFSETVLSGVSAGVFGINQQFEITLANLSACELLNLQALDVFGKDLKEVAPFFGELLETLKDSSNGSVHEMVEFDKGNQHLILSVNITPDGGQGYVVTFDDMSQLVSDQRSAAWREVARRIAHEIRNPLTPIQLSAERLKRKYRKEISSSPKIFDRCIETIIRQVGDIGRMVDEFSSFARMPVPKIESVELSQLVTDTAFSQQVSFPDVNIEIDKEEKVFVLCDARLAAQAILNVIKNAAESTSSIQSREDGQPPNVHLRIWRDNQFAFLDVIDNGPGWPRNNRQKLTEPYYTTRQKGTGLGLAIVKRIMEDHKGQLELLDRDDLKSGAVSRLGFPVTEPNENSEKS